MISVKAEITRVLDGGEDVHHTLRLAGEPTGGMIESMCAKPDERAERLGERRELSHRRNAGEENRNWAEQLSESADERLEVSPPPPARVKARGVIDARDEDHDIRTPLLHLRQQLALNIWEGKARTADGVPPHSPSGAGR
jgi:hypothetical protein